ncbi:MAG: hypothetical protein R3236_08665, partial [Phycisphaeraceae bacterium]|nr:hypothetical protein [Phycisphaeraceae bacterium]
MKSGVGLGVLVLILVGGSTARAQDLDLGELADLLDTAAKEFKAGSKAVLEKHDLDGDGRLNPEERRAADQDIQNQLQITRETFRARREAKYDVDGDGRLSPEERAEMQRAQEERRRQWRERMKEMQEEARRQAELEKWDKDKDGKLSEEELAAKKAAEEA